MHGSGIDASRSKMTRKEIEASNRNGQGYVRIELTGSIYPVSPQGPERYADGSKLDITMTVDYCADGSLFDVKQTARVQADVRSTSEFGRRRHKVSGTVSRSLTEVEGPRSAPSEGRAGAKP
jgi:hypothetical protein